MYCRVTAAEHDVILHGCRNTGCPICPCEQPQPASLSQAFVLTLSFFFHISGLRQLRDLDLHGCRNIVNPVGHNLPCLPLLTALTSLSLRNCEGLQDEALQGLAPPQLHRLDISGESPCTLLRTLLACWLACWLGFASVTWAFGLGSCKGLQARAAAAKLSPMRWFSALCSTAFNFTGISYTA